MPDSVIARDCPQCGGHYYPEDNTVLNAEGKVEGYFYHECNCGWRWIEEKDEACALPEPSKRPVGRPRQGTKRKYKLGRTSVDAELSEWIALAIRAGTEKSWSAVVNRALRELSEKERWFDD